MVMVMVLMTLGSGVWIFVLVEVFGSSVVTFHEIRFYECMVGWVCTATLHNCTIED